MDGERTYRRRIESGKRIAAVLTLVNKEIIIVSPPIKKG